MSSRIATGSTGGRDSIRSLIRSNPSVIESGLRLFDFDFKFGAASIIEAIGADRSGGLVIVAVASGDPEAALARLLDGHLWVADQRDLLARLYADRGVRINRPARGFLLAPSFTHAFLRRLSLLSVEVSPCLARDVESADGTRLTIVEPAARLFGLEPVERPGLADAGRVGRQPFWPEGVLPSEDTASPGGIPRVTDTAQPDGGAAVADEPGPDQEMPWPDTPEERFPWDPEVEHAGGTSGEGDVSAAVSSPGLPALPDEPATPGPFEALSAEELDEFESFERQRHERRGRSS